MSAVASLPARSALAMPLAGALAVFLAVAAAHWPNKLDHDVAYFLDAGRMLNQGWRLYVDLIDFNTPGNFTLGRLSAWLAETLNTPLDLTHKGVILALALVSLSLSFAVLTPLLKRRGAGRWVIALGLPGILLMATPELGAREQLLSFGVLPWALAVARAGDMPRSLPLGVAIGAFAGLALCLKPHFALFGLALGVADLVRSRGLARLLAATWAAAAVSIALYLSLLILHPEWLREMAPFALDTYGRFQGRDFAALRTLLEPARTVSIVAAAAAAYYLTRSTGRFPWRAAGAACAVMLAALAIFLQQGFGFPYQILPLKIGIAVCGLFVLAWAVDAAPTPDRSRVIAAALAAAAALLSLYARPNMVEPYQDRRELMAEPLFQALKPPQPSQAILVISTSMDPGSEMLSLMDARWAGPIMPFIATPALIEQNGRFGIDNAPPPEVRKRWADWFRTRAARRLKLDPPVRVAVEVTSRPFFFDNGGFDVLGWLREDQAFDEAWRAAGLEASGEPIVRGHLAYQIYTAAGR